MSSRLERWKNVQLFERVLRLAVLEQAHHVEDTEE